MVSIVTNLMVSNANRSTQFYRDLLGFDVATRVPIEGEILGDNQPDQEIIFATVKFGECELMLQQKESFIQEAPGIDPSQTPSATASLYLRVDNLEDLITALGDAVLTEPHVSWYGMKEIWAQDPDGYLLTIGQTEGPAPL